MMYSPNIIAVMDQPNAQFFFDLYLNAVMYILLYTICDARSCTHTHTHTPYQIIMFTFRTSLFI